MEDYNWIYNPKTKGSGVICCIPQVGACPNKCPDCFFQSGRSYLEPLCDNLPHIPSSDMAENRVVRMNDGNDSNYQRKLVEAVALGYKHVFFNTSQPYELDKFPAPFVLTINPNLMTDVDFHRVDPIPKNIMFVRVRVNTWNPEVLTTAVQYYTSREVRVVITFMRYYTESISEEQKELYTFEKKVTNSYWYMKRSMQKDILSSFEDNPFVYECGYKDTHSCKFCGNCIREYYRVIEECRL